MRLGGVEPQQEIAGGHPPAVANCDLGYHTAGRMLDGFHVGLNHEIAGHHDRARQRHQRSPAANQHGRHDQHAKPGLQLALEGETRSRGQALA